MDCKILKLGKFNMVERMSLERDMFVSGCYFDWIKLETIVDSAEIGSLSEAFNFKKILSKKAQNYENIHMQESLILMSNENSIDISKSQVLYVSLINIPMWNEDIIEKLGHDIIRLKIKEAINDIIKNHKAAICLYNTFDHCDYVLVCDGMKMSFNDYMSIIKKLRNAILKLDSGEELKAIHDITTIYGFNLIDSLENFEFCHNEKVNLVLSISFKSANYIVKFRNLLTNNGIESPTLDFEITGRYDRMIIWKEIQFKHLIYIIKSVADTKDNFFATKIHIGFEDDGKVNPVSNTNPNSELLNVAKIKFKECEEKLKSILNFDDSLFIALKEVHNSISTMLKRGFAQYYILCFYESFYNFIDFILKKLDLNNVKLVAEKKQIKEEIYDMFTKYFAFLNALNASTLHSDRQFLQIDSYHVMYFDAPPKLIAFYTAMANKMATILNNDANSEYTFLITPDFKSNVFVEELTRDQTIGNEKNILIIHINEESMYNVPSTLRIIAHEIAHHVGQNAKNREKRFGLYLKSFLSYIIFASISPDLIPTKNNVSSFFDKLVDTMYENIFDDNWYNECVYNEKISYYSDSVVKPAMNRIISQFEKNGQKIIEKSLNKAFETEFDYTEAIDTSFWKKLFEEYKDGNSRTVLKEFTIKKISFIYYSRIKDWLYSLQCQDLFKEIKYLFRESYADLRMIMLTINPEIDSVYDVYCKILGIENIDENKFVNIDLLRFSIVMSVFNAKDKEKAFINYFNKILNDGIWNEPENNIQHDIKMFYQYLHKKVQEYLLYILNEEKSNTKYDESVKNVICTLEKIKDNSFELIIDKEIYDYRVRLLNNQKSHS